jgi:urease accessory protein UreF
MIATLDAADPQRTIAELQRQLDACRAELAARNSEFGTRETTLDVSALNHDVGCTN